MVFFAGLGDKTLAAVTQDDLDLFVSALRAEGLAASTRNKYTAAQAPFR